MACIEPHLPSLKATGRPRVHVHPLREILNAAFYVLRGGCAWRLLPYDFPPWKTVYHYFIKWRLDKTWEKVNAAVRERLWVRLGRYPRPRARIVDSQSVKTTGVGGARLQRRQADKGQKTPYPRQYRGVSAQSQGPLCQRLRPRRDKAASGGSQGVVAAHVPPVA